MAPKSGFFFKFMIQFISDRQQFTQPKKITKNKKYAHANVILLLLFF